VRIELPFAALTDRQVARLGRRLGVPLDLTWSCYRDGAEPCGRCPACRDRRDALDGFGT
jgi:7-cyano-7-deazaguanine synthase